MEIVIRALLIMISIILLITVFYIAINERAEKKAKEKELEELKKTNDCINTAITQASKTKADARTGNHERDFNYIANKLHDYANE